MSHQTAMPGLASALIGLIALTATGSPAAAQAAEETPTAYSCTFKTGTSRSYSKSRFKIRRAKPLAFGIEAIDLEAQKALLSTPSGKGPLRVVRALGANHFLEVVAEGYLNITTVYALDARKRAYPAVHSRHIGLFGEPLVAQYVGYCTQPLPAKTPAAAPSTRKKEGK